MSCYVEPYRTRPDVLTDDDDEDLSGLDDSPSLLAPVRQSAHYESPLGPSAQTHPHIFLSKYSMFCGMPVVGSPQVATALLKSTEAASTTSHSRCARPVARRQCPLKSSVIRLLIRTAVWGGSVFVVSVLRLFARCAPCAVRCGACGRVRGWTRRQPLEG